MVVMIINHVDAPVGSLFMRWSQLMELETTTLWSKDNHHHWIQEPLTNGSILNAFGSDSHSEWVGQKFDWRAAINVKITN